jgi:hypothetical protein
VNSQLDDNEVQSGILSKLRGSRANALLDGIIEIETIVTGHLLDHFFIEFLVPRRVLEARCNSIFRISTFDRIARVFQKVKGNARLCHIYLVVWQFDL